MQQSIFLKFYMNKQLMQKLLSDEMCFVFCLRHFENQDQYNHYDHNLVSRLTIICFFHLSQYSRLLVKKHFFQINFDCFQNYKKLQNQAILCQTDNNMLLV